MLAEGRGAAHTPPSRHQRNDHLRRSVNLSSCTTAQQVYRSAGLQLYRPSRQQGQDGEKRARTGIDIEALTHRHRGLDPIDMGGYYCFGGARSGPLSCSLREFRLPRA